MPPKKGTTALAMPWAMSSWLGSCGLWDDNFICLSEKLVEPGQVPGNGFTQRYWHVRAGEVVLATGAIERPLTFANNDLPGVMLSQAVRTYVTRFGVVPGRKVPWC